MNVERSIKVDSVGKCRESSCCRPTSLKSQPGFALLSPHSHPLKEKLISGTWCGPLLFAHERCHLPTTPPPSVSCPAFGRVAGSGARGGAAGAGPVPRGSPWGQWQERRVASRRGGGVGWGRRRRGAPAATRANRALPKGVAAVLPSRAPGTSKRPMRPGHPAELWGPAAPSGRLVAMTPARSSALSLALLVVALAAEPAAGTVGVSSWCSWGW